MHQVGDISLSNISYLLSYRFKAEELSTDGYQEATVALFQGTAFLLCLIVGEIFMRISKTTAKDVVEFKFSKLECAILLCSIVQGFISLGLGSLKGKLFAEGVFFLGSIFMMTIISQVRPRRGAKRRAEKGVR